MSVFVLVSYSLYYYGLWSSLKSGSVISLALFFFSQNCFGCLGSFVGPTSFRIISSIPMKNSLLFDGDCVETVDSFG